MDKLIDSGMFMWKSAFLAKNPTAELLEDCTDVVVYSDGSFIQLLKSGEYYLDSDNKSLSLGEVEKILLEKNNNKLNDV